MSALSTRTTFVATPSPLLSLFLGCLANAYPTSLFIASLLAHFFSFLIVLAPQGASAAFVPASLFALFPRIAPKGIVGTYVGVIVSASLVGLRLERRGMRFTSEHWGLQGGPPRLAQISAKCSSVREREIVK